MGIPWGAANNLNTFMALLNSLPNDWINSAFSIARHQMHYVAATILAGGHIHVVLEYNLWLAKGVLETNSQLEEKTAAIAANMGANLMTPAQIRTLIKVEERASLSS